MVTIVIVSCLCSAAGMAQKQNPPEGGTAEGFHTSCTDVLYPREQPAGHPCQLRPGTQGDGAGCCDDREINEAENEVWLADLTGNLMKEGTTTRSARSRGARKQQAWGVQSTSRSGLDQNNSRSKQSSLSPDPDMVDPARRCHPKSSLSRVRTSPSEE